MTRYVEERRAVFGVEPICRALGVPVCSFYARRNRKPSAREFADRELIREIHAAREGYRRVYGVRKTWKELRRRGSNVGRERVARPMRREGLEGVRRGKKRRTTIADEAALERGTSPSATSAPLLGATPSITRSPRRGVATFKSELVDGRRFPGYEHAEHEMLNWISFYNASEKPRAPHSSSTPACRSGAQGRSSTAPGRVIA